MSERPITIVDTHDKPIGAASIAEARRVGLAHRIVRIMVEDGKGRILLQKRSNKVKTYPNCWDHSAAGHVDIGEDYLSAALRELREEIGIKRQQLEDLGTYYTDRSVSGVRLKRFNRVYKTVGGKHEVVIDNDEVSEVEWLNIGDVRKLIEDHPEQVTDGLIDVVNKYY